MSSILSLIIIMAFMLIASPIAIVRLIWMISEWMALNMITGLGVSLGMEVKKKPEDK